MGQQMHSLTNQFFFKGEKKEILSELLTWFHQILHSISLISLSLDYVSDTVRSLSENIDCREELLHSQYMNFLLPTQICPEIVVFCFWFICILVFPYEWNFSYMITNYVWTLLLHFLYHHHNYNSYLPHWLTMLSCFNSFNLIKKILLLRFWMM